MTQWSAIWSRFHELRELPHALRAQRLEEIRKAEPALADELSSLLDAEGSSGVLDKDLEIETAAGEQDAPLPDSIGPFRIIRKIGEGGMGLVLEAEQTEPIQRRVALKIIKRGMDTDNLLRRFVMERQVLALMNHPGIATVIDAGATEDGRPYFVMEYVDGTSLVKWCDQRKYPLRNRLILFGQVCRAVHHAHQKGIIHRDLKPSNILVGEHDGKPRPKIIDFGISKAIESGARSGDSVTRIGGILGTPGYMSPEQLGISGDIDIRTDVFSLGVILYELLCGTLPVSSPTTTDFAAIDAHRKALQTDPPSPSSRVHSFDRDTLGDIASARAISSAVLRRRLRGDLDWIAMKAIEVDKERRYSSVAELADDIDRFLDSQPVSAGPPSTAYRAKKFIQRNPVGVVAAAGLVVALAGVTIATAIQSNRVSSALARADRELSRSKQVTSFLVDVFREADPKVRRLSDPSDVTVVELLDRASGRADQALDDTPEAHAAVLSAMGQAYMNIGEMDRSRELLEQALHLREGSPNSTRAEIAQSYELLGAWYDRTDQLDQAERFLQRALEEHQAMGDPSGIAESLVRLGSLRLNQGDHEAALEFVERALQSVDESGVGNTSARRMATDMMAVVLMRLARLDESRQWYERAISLAREADDSDLGDLLANFGAMLWEQASIDEAEVALREALDLQRKLYGEKSLSVTSCLNNLALVLHHKNDFDGAEAAYLEAIEIADAAYGYGNHSSHALYLNNLGLVAHDRGELTKAESYLREALDVQVSRVGEDHPNVAFHLTNLARVLMDDGRPVEAEPLLIRALQVRRDRLRERHPLTASTMSWYGLLMTKTGRAARALPLLEDALTIRKEGLGEEDWRTKETGSHLGLCYVALGRTDEARDLLLEGVRAVESQRGADHRRSHAARQRAARYYRAIGDTEAAAKLESGSI